MTVWVAESCGVRASW